MRPLVALLAATAIAAAAEEAKLSCAEQDRKCAYEAARNHPTKKQAYWESAFARPLAERIGPAPPEVIELLTLDNIAHGYPNKPRPPKLEPAFMADVRRAFAEIPANVRRHLDAKLGGIYFVEDLGGTGFADEIAGTDGEAHTGFIVLDPSVLERHVANGWATWKDGTPFKPATGWRLSTRIEDEVNNTRANAIQYILLHELGHILSIGADAHPRWTMAPRNVDPRREYPFFRISWTVDEGKYVPIPEDDFPQRKNVVFYFGAKLPGETMGEVYAALMRTRFPTLYAATHPGDDFAEAFANYVHVVLMGKPYEVRIEQDGAAARRYGACWEELRCAEKRRYLERFLRR